MIAASTVEGHIMSTVIDVTFTIHSIVIRLTSFTDDAVLFANVSQFFPDHFMEILNLRKSRRFVFQELPINSPGECHGSEFLST